MVAIDDIDVCHRRVAVGVGNKPAIVARNQPDEHEQVLPFFIIMYIEVHISCRVSHAEVSLCLYNNGLQHALMNEKESRSENDRLGCMTDGSV